MAGMKGPLELAIGLRYLRARRRTRFVSFITLASSIGIAVGVAALIVILSVMNGFENELRSRLLSMTAHASVTGADGTLERWPAVLERVAAEPGVEAAAPYVEFEAMARSRAGLQPLFVTGIDPVLETGVSAAAASMVSGRLERLQPGTFNIVLGRLLAINLGVRVGDEVMLLIPRLTDGEVRPELRRFGVAGIFEAGLQDHDASLALVALADAAAIRRLGDAVTGIRVKTDDVMRAPSIAESIAAALEEGPGRGYETSDWSRQNASYFRAVRLEKTMMSLILSLIVAVAAFNIVASLVMVVTDKETDIAILRTLGMAPGSVMRVFLTQGLVIGWVGAIGGVALGTLLAVNVPVIVPVLEQAFGFQIMPGD
ncbi:MAG TPA: lipoprotein-releasing ABC transporter permease subunit, partial [Woeseiaceae bacterium]|nr:lipoprotein-releasing ABC transporter permease subunit [Woeseiaceae bacterium]